MDKEIGDKFLWGLLDGILSFFGLLASVAGEVLGMVVQSISNTIKGWKRFK